MSKLVELDVRELLRAKQEPFQKIMAAAEGLTESGDTFVLTATFKPNPLIGVMANKGFASRVEEIAEDHWVVTFTHG